MVFTVYRGLVTFLCFIATQAEAVKAGDQVKVVLLGAQRGGDAATFLATLVLLKRSGDTSPAPGRTFFDAYC